MPKIVRRIHARTYCFARSSLQAEVQPSKTTVRLPCCWSTDGVAVSPSSSITIMTNHPFIGCVLVTLLAASSFTWSFSCCGTKGMVGVAATTTTAADNYPFSAIVQSAAASAQSLGAGDDDGSSSSSSSCLRSNSTHIVWRKTLNSVASTDTEASDNRRGRVPKVPSSDAGCCTVQTRKEAEHDCMAFLKRNLMPFDLPFARTLGFPKDDEDNDENSVDGLDNGLIGPTIRLALDAKVMYEWTDSLPRHIFQNYVLNYANLNEARTNWRPLLVDALKFNESALFKSGQANVPSVTDWVNQHVWSTLGKPNGKAIFFKSSQTPLIFDPMSIIAFGYASCTGVSILLCNALRAVGVPARVVGTPAWYGNQTQGNHNWVEVYVGEGEGSSKDDKDEQWNFLEGLPANPGDALDGDPCNRWFCDSSRYPSSKVYAAKMSRCPCYQEQGMATSSSFQEEQGDHMIETDDKLDEYFPLAWEWDCQDVPAVDRTDYYTKVCAACPKD